MNRKNDDFQGPETSQLLKMGVDFKFRTLLGTKIKRHQDSEKCFRAESCTDKSYSMRTTVIVLTCNATEEHTKCLTRVYSLYDTTEENIKKFKSECAKMFSDKPYTSTMAARKNYIFCMLSIFFLSTIATVQTLFRQ